MLCKKNCCVKNPGSTNTHSHHSWYLIGLPTSPSQYHFFTVWILNVHIFSWTLIILWTFFDYLIIIFYLAMLRKTQEIRSHLEMVYEVTENSLSKFLHSECRECFRIYSMQDLCRILGRHVSVTQEVEQVVYLMDHYRFGPLLLQSANYCPQWWQVLCERWPVK